MTDIKVFSGEDENDSTTATRQPDHKSGVELTDSEAAAAAAAAADEEAEADRKSRAFVACANCVSFRRAKAKCDLDPPCARCRRRAIACEFLPSRRSGRMSYEARQAQKAAEENGTSSTAPPVPTIETSTVPPTMRTSKSDRPSASASASASGSRGAPATSQFSHTQSQTQKKEPWQAPALQAPIASGSATTSIAAPSNLTIHSSWPEEWQRFAEAKGLFESQSSDPSPGATSHTSQEASASAISVSSTAPRSNINMPSSSLAQNARNDQDRTRPTSSKRKSRQKDEDRAEELAAANLQNPVDAMSLLVMAAGERKGPSTSHRGNSRKQVRLADGLDGLNRAETRTGDGDETASSGSRGDDDGLEGTGGTTYQLSDFPLVKRSVLNTIEVFYYVNLFFTKVHPIFPLVPHHRIPRTEAQLTAFAKAELHLTTVFILIASRLDQGAGNQARIHEQTWEYMQELITRLVFGEEVSVGALEALLLLSENPPRALANAGNHREDFAEENRMSWNIVGLAVRLGYMLSLDQISFHPIRHKGKDTQDAADKHERERVAWTYCFLFDRQIAIRTGKAFWSRGPGLMFSGSSIDYFPSMRPIPGVQDDYAGLLQAYAEITQILQNSHDVLYPSKDRSVALVSNGEYHKHLDEFTRALNNYRTFWEPKQWTTFPLTECVWVTFHYVRLYIYAFAFQASVQRGIQQAQGSSVEAVKTGIFKRGTMNSPDARFLMESIEAACDMLRICTDRLHPSNVLQYLPWRYFLYFSYAGVFLLKAIFLNAVASHERRNTVRLLRRLIVCLAGTSSDPHHHAVRYARLLDSLLRTFSRGQDGVDTSSPHGHAPQSSTRRTEATIANSNYGQSPWPVSRPASPGVGQSLGAQSSGSSTGIQVDGNVPAPFWGGNTQNAQEPRQFQGLGSNTLGDYRNFGEASSFSSGFSLPGQGNQAPTSYGYLDGSGNSASYMQLVNHNLGSGQTGISPHSDSMVLPLEAYTNLLDDTTLDFWTALTNSQDWQNQTDATFSNMFPSV